MGNEGYQDWDLLPKFPQSSKPVFGLPSETVDEYNSEAEERLLSMKKKQKLVPIMPEEVERRL